MLVLTRRVGEKIVISDDICVTIVEVSGDRVRVGVEAPKSVRVDRHEVHVRRQLDSRPLRKLQLAEAF
jgi:carbon storage regulator